MAAPTLVQSAIGSNGNSAATATRAAIFAGNVTAGNWIVAAIRVSSTDADAGSVTDTRGNIYTLQQASTGAGNTKVAIFLAPSLSTGANTVTFTPVSGSVIMSLAVAEVAPAASATIVKHTSAGGAGTSATMVGTSLVTSVDTLMLAFIYGFNAFDTWTVTGGFANLQSTAFSSVSASLIQKSAAPGTHTPGWSNSTSGAYEVASIALANFVSTVVVPDVVGDLEADAMTAITAAGLTVGTITSGDSATVPAGRVISQSPTAGTNVAPGSAVSLVVSTGLVAVPDVVGDLQSAAVAAITAAGLTVGTITWTLNASVPAGTVLSQSPAAGTIVDPGTAVDLVLSTGPPVPGPVPPGGPLTDLVTVRIEGVDQTSQTRAVGSFAVEHQLGARSRCTLEVRDFDSTATAYRPGLDDAVDIIGRGLKPYDALVREDGAANYWRLDEVGSGDYPVTWAYNAVGTARGSVYPGTSFGQWSPIAGTTAYGFDGVTGQVVTEEVDIAAPLTVELWIRMLNATATGNEVPFATYVDAPALTMLILATGQLSLSATGTSGTMTAHSTRSVLNIHQYHHVVWVIPASGAWHLYIDGAEDTLIMDTAVIAITGSTTNACYFATSNFNQRFPGFLDEIALYPVALTAAQAAEHYANREAAWLFSGEIQDVQDGPLGEPGIGTVTACEAVDFWVIASTRRVHEIYAAGATLKAVVTDLFTKYIDGAHPTFDLTLDPSMLDGPVLPALTFDFATLEDVFNQLSELTAWLYRVRPVGLIEWFPPGSRILPTIFRIDQLTVLGAVRWRQTRSTHVNRQLLRYGTASTVEKRDDWVGDGVWTTRDPTYPGLILSTPVVTEDGTAHTLGVWGVDATLWTYERYADRWGVLNLVRLHRSSPAPVGAAVGFVYGVPFPQVCVSQNDADIAVRGVWDAMEDAPDIFDLVQAQAHGDALLARYQGRARELALTTRRFIGVLPGDMTVVDLPDRTLPLAYWLVTAVRIILDVDGRFTTHLTLLEGVEALGGGIGANWRVDWLEYWRRSIGNSGGSPSGTSSGALVPASAPGSAPALHRVSHEPGGMDPMTVDSTASIGSLRTLGPGANQAAPGNDARFTAAPTAHHATHEPGGTDVLQLTDTGLLLGRATAGAGAVEEITIGDNLFLDGTTISATSRNSAFVVYSFSAVQAAPPGTNQIRFDAGYPYTAVTKVWTAIVTADGQDVYRGLLIVPTGSTLLVQDKNDHTQYALFTTTGPPVDLTTYVEFPVVHQAHGSSIGGGQLVLVQNTGGPAGAPAAHHATHETGGVDAIAALDAGVITTGTFPYARLQDVSAASRLLGRGSASGSGDAEEITLGTGLALSGTTLSATGSGVTFVRKTADESVTSSTTLQDDDHLSLALAASASYLIEFTLFYDAATAGDLKWDWVGPTDLTGHAGALRGSNTATTSEGNIRFSAGAFTGGVAPTLSAGGTAATACVQGTLVVHTVSAGTLKLRWAQETSSGTATILRANSYLVATRVA